MRVENSNSLFSIDKKVEIIVWLVVRYSVGTSTLSLNNEYSKLEIRI